MRPGDARGVSGLAGLLAPGGICVLAGCGPIAGLRIENARLQKERRFLREKNLVFDADLRRPTPNISGVIERRRGLHGKRGGSERREEEMVLTGNDGGVCPIEMNYGGAEADDAHGFAIGGFLRETAGEIEIDAGTGASAGDIGAESLD